jgi:hypothetical protein
MKEMEQRMESILGRSYTNTFHRARDLVDIEFHHFDIYNPEFHQQVEKFVDEWIPHDHRSPAKHKTLKIIEGDGSDGPYHIPGEDGLGDLDVIQSSFTTRFRLSKPTLRGRLKAWIKRVWSFAWGESTEDYYWDHALIRHFGISKSEIEEFYKTVAVLRQQDQSKIEEDTEKIRKNHNKK